MKQYLIGGKLLCIITVVFLFCSQSNLMAQTRNVKGSVSDAHGDALIGATIIEKITKEGVIVDLDGNFKIDVPSDNAELTISMLGYESKTVKPLFDKPMNIVLELSSENLDELVVVGYGFVKKKEITGSVAIVGSDQIAKLPIGNATEALQGIASGVTVTQQSGSPGAGSVVQVRGIGSITGGIEPLYVVDGLPQTSISHLSPNDIESIAVHKDASVSAIYGSRASNGVILITTKSGSKDGTMSVSYDFYVGSQSALTRPEVLNAAEFIEYKNLARTNAGQAPRTEFATQESIDEILDFVTKNTGVDGTDWWGEIARDNALMQSHNLRLSGGTEKVSFSSSLGYFDQEGIIIGPEYNRLTWRNTIDSKINDRVKVSMNVGLIYETRKVIDENNNVTGAIYTATVADPITPVYRDNLIDVPAIYSNIMNGYEASNPYSQYAGILYSNKRNPVAYNERMADSRYETLKVKTGLNAEVKIIDELTYSARLGVDLSRSFNSGFDPEYYLNAYDNNPLSHISNSTPSSSFYVFDHTLSYDNTWGELHMTSLVGMSAEYTEGRSFSGSIEGLPNNDESMRIISSGTTNPSVSGYSYSKSIASYFGRLNLAYLDRYVVSLNARIDGSSNFAPAYRWGKFPSVSAAWRFTEEKFIKNSIGDIINDAKLRASYGLIGNQSVSGSAKYTSTYGTSTWDRYQFGNEYSVNLTGGRQSAGEPGLQWETSKQLDIGLDLSFFNTKLRFTGDYFEKKVENMLLVVPLSTTLGYPNDPYSNAGNMQNTGWEFDLSYDGQIDKLTYNINANISTYKNMVTSIGTGESITNGGYGIGSDFTMTEVGMPVGYFYGYKTDGIFQNDQEVANSSQSESATPGDIRFLDITGEGDFDDNDRTMIGSPWPDFVYGLSLNLAYKGFDFSMFWQGSQGNDVVNIQRYYTESGGGYYNAPKGFIEKSWHGEGTTNEYHKISEDQGMNGLMSDYYVEDGSYLRLKNLQVGYNFTKRLIKSSKVKQLRVYAGVKNLVTFTGYSGLDPEIGSGEPTLTGIDSGFYPQARTITIGLNSKF